MKTRQFVSALATFILLLGAGIIINNPKAIALPKHNIMEDNQIYDTATFGMGCFWCTEAFFTELKGVKSVTVGYSGGKGKNPTYDDVVFGNTGYAEVAEIIYDPKLISFKDLLEVFWKVHDPTTLNRQGADRGIQYRSVIFYHNPEQEHLAKEYKIKLNNSGAFSKPIITQIEPFTAFYPAEKYHQNYYSDNKNAPYCTFVIKPKLNKFRKVFADKLKKNISEK
ncbi:MAG: peptide-methionine (S)-S-oxide reductase MsrA [Bacteroidales bacterium]